MCKIVGLGSRIVDFAIFCKHAQALDLLRHAIATPNGVDNK